MGMRSNETSHALLSSDKPHPNASHGPDIRTADDHVGSGSITYGARMSQTLIVYFDELGHSCVNHVAHFHQPKQRDEQPPLLVRLQP